MDLLTQGLLGGALAASVAGEKQSRFAAGIGGLAAMLADADILIRSADDPLLNIEFHRHFTHALIFIPFGALFAAVILWPLLQRRIAFGAIYAYALLGYATAGLLDACTSYGTQLLWPFSEERISWSIIAIVDPVFTLILLLALLRGWRHRNAGPARVGLALAGVYLLIGAWQHQNALQAARDLAASRGHAVERILVKPTLANLVLWRSVYQSGDSFFVDAVRVGPGPERVYPGGSARRFVRERDRPDLPATSVLAGDIERFERLADGFVIADPGRDRVLTDVRYSMLPTTLAPLWGLDLNVASTAQHANFVNYRDRPDNLGEIFVAMLLGRDLPR